MTPPATWIVAATRQRPAGLDPEHERVRGQRQHPTGQPGQQMRSDLTPEESAAGRHRRQWQDGSPQKEQPTGVAGDSARTPDPQAVNGGVHRDDHPGQHGGGDRRTRGTGRYAAHEDQSA